MYTELSVHLEFFTAIKGSRTRTHNTLKIFPAHETGIDIIVGERDRAEFLKVKVEDGSIDGVQIRAAPAQLVGCVQTDGEKHASLMASKKLP